MGVVWVEFFGFGLFKGKNEIAAQPVVVNFDFVLDGHAFRGGGFGECDGQFGGGEICTVGHAEFEPGWLGIACVDEFGASLER